MPATRKGTTRTYGEFCPVAAGLDVLGDRWVLLIIRELLFTDRRWGELRRALPGISPNLLSERLSTLQERGVVHKTAADDAYSLTDKGRSTGPILAAIARFGADYLDFDHSVVAHPETADARRTAMVFLMGWIRPKSPRMRARIVVPDGSRVDIVVAGKDSRLTDPDTYAPDVTVHTSIAELGAVRSGRAPFAGRIDGSASAVAAFREAFDLD